MAAAFVSGDARADLAPEKGAAAAAAAAAATAVERRLRTAGERSQQPESRRQKAARKTAAKAGETSAASLASSISRASLARKTAATPSTAKAKGGGSCTCLCPPAQGFGRCFDVSAAEVAKADASKTDVCASLGVATMQARETCPMVGVVRCVGGERREKGERKNERTREHTTSNDDDSRHIANPHPPPAQQPMQGQRRRVPRRRAEGLRRHPARELFGVGRRRSVRVRAFGRGSGSVRRGRGQAQVGAVLVPADGVRRVLVHGGRGVRRRRPVLPRDQVVDVGA